MPSTADIYRSAQVLRREHGEGALDVAVTRSEEHRNVDDEEGAAVWHLIAMAIEELQRMEPERDELRH